MLTCPNCGRESPDDFAFCPACSTPLTPAAPAREVRKTVSIVFCDVTGSTALGERLDPESVRWVMSGFFEAAREVLERHGGTVEKFIGDAVMAAFGIPRVREDDALRGARAAAELRDRLRVFGAEVQARYGTGVGVRIGVNTGEVIAGDASAGQAFASGDAVNVAARLEQAAAPGEVLIGEATLRLVRDAVTVETVEPLALKGKSHPLPAWRLVSVSRLGPGVARRLDAPLIGRARELAELRGYWQRTVDERDARVVTIIAPAGTGKTRLMGAFAESVREEAGVLIGRCLAYGEGITFWPIAEVVRSAAGIEADDSLELARSKLAALLAGEDTQGEIAPRIETVLGLSEQPGALEETFFAVRKLFEALARRRPLVVVLDDVHWAEETLLDLIEYLAGWTRGVPFLLLSTARPELLERRSSVTTPRANANALLLEPLSGESADRLMAWQLGDVPLEGGLHERVLGIAQGNPLFVQELVRMLIDDELIVRRNGSWAAAGDVSELAMPPTIQAVLAARLDQLGAPERDIAQRASVVGHVFSWSAVRELCAERARGDLSGHLHTLVRSELIVPEASAAGEDAFRFGHVLVRDAAYDGLAKRLRAELHERLASWLDEARGSRAVEQEEFVAYHLEHAAAYRRELGDEAEARRIAELAARRLGEAGRRALASGDLPAAANLLGRAAEVLPGGDPRRATLQLEAVPALVEIGRAPELDAMFEEILATSEETAVLLEARSWRAFLAMQRSSMTDDAETSMDAANAWIASCERSGDHAGQATALGFLAKDRFWEGQAALAEALWLRSAEHAVLAGDHREEAEALTWVLVAGTYGPTTVEAALERCAAIARRAGASRKVRVMASIERGVLLAMQGDVERGRELVANGRDQLRELGLMFLASVVAQEATFVERSAGDAAAAEAQLRPSFDALGELGESGFQMTIAGFLARALYEQGRLEEARPFAAMAQTDEEDWSAEGMALRAFFAADAGEHETALALVEAAVERTNQCDFLFIRAERYVDLATVHLLAGRRAEAEAALAQAEDLYARKGWLTALALLRTRFAALGLSA
jgi:class 3 adenylate cyclase/tetratricopeptide (TPR) repeat protein